MDRRAALAALTAPGEPYELEEVELFGRTCRAFRHAPPTLRDLFEQSRSDLPFIVYDDERLSFEETWGQACRIEVAGPEAVSTLTEELRERFPAAGVTILDQNPMPSV